MKFQSIMKGVAFAGAVAFATGAMADGGPRGSLKDAGPAPFSWTGLYVGVHAGGAHSNQDVQWSASPVGFPATGPALNQLGSGGLHGSSFTGGGQIGLNYQINGLVVGVEADLSYLDIDGNRSANLTTLLGGANSPIASNYSIGWLATVRGRVGLAFDRWLVYATGGVAWADMSISDRVNFGASGTFNAASRSETVMGYVVGGGVEWAFQKNWTLRGEILHVSLDDVSTTSRNNDTVTFPNALIGHNHRNTEINIIRAGVNYKF